MAFEKITENVENISLLADTPAMSTENLKAEFDKGNKTIKTKFNKLVDDLNELDLLTPENSTKYSTDEVKIGTWMGKPLYRKTYIADIAAATLAGSIQLNLSDIDTIFVDSGNSYMIHGSSSIVQVGFYAGSSDYTRAYIRGDKTAIGYNMGSAYNSGSKTLVVTVKYTKTTD